MLLSLCFTTQRQAAVGYIEETPTEKSVEANSDLLLGEASLGGDLVDLLLLQLQLRARVAHLKEAAGRGEVFLSKKKPEREVGEGEVGDGEGEGGHEGIWNWTGSPGRVLP